MVSQACGRCLVVALGAWAAAACSSVPEPKTKCQDVGCKETDRCTSAGRCIPKSQFECETASQCAEYLKGPAGNRWEPKESPICHRDVCAEHPEYKDVKVCQRVPVVAGSKCDEDGIGCTLGQCDEQGSCDDTGAIEAKTCYIESAGRGDQRCIPEGTEQPDNPCKVCNPALETSGYSPRKLGAACSVAGAQPCEVAQCNGSGACELTGDVRAGRCLVQEYDTGGQPTGQSICVEAGAVRPGSGECVRCDPASSKAWTVRSDGNACKDGSECRPGACKGGKCQASGILPGHCLIASKDKAGKPVDLCVKEGALSQDNPCEVCKATANTQWTPLPTGATCTDDGVACTEDACDGEGQCRATPIDSACPDTGQPCARDVCDLDKGCTTAPKAATQTCAGDSLACTVEHCDGQGSCAPVGTPDDGACDDGIACTADACDASGSVGEGQGCTHTPDGGYAGCGDGNVCTEDVCEAHKGCVHRPATTSCKGDGLSCTADRCAAGVCTHSLSGDACLIGGVCRLAGEVTASGCQVCSPGVSDHVWTPSAATASCSEDGLVCTLDLCDGQGVCRHDQVSPTQCLIDGQLCANAGQISAGGCLVCAPTTNARGWTAVAAKAPCTEDGLVCTLDLCDGQGVCTHDTVAPTHCLITGGQGKICVPSGATTSGKCLVCDPSGNSKGWTRVGKGIACDPDAWSCTADLCDGQGGCEHDPRHSLCADKLDCTLDTCAPGNPQAAAKTGCANVDRCAYGHVCNTTKNACTTPKPVVLVSASASDPSPTNPAVVRQVLDAGQGLHRTWVVYQSRSCTTASGGQWSVSQGARLRAVVLDEVLAPAQEKVAGSAKYKPPVVTLASHFGTGSGLCQAFPVVSPDPLSSTQAWVQWLEADVGKGSKGGCINAMGQGGVVRWALLDTSGVQDGQVWTKAAGSVCPLDAGQKPVLLTAGFGLLDAVGAATSDPAQRGLLSVRPKADSLTSVGDNQLLASGTAGALGWARAVTLLGEFSPVHPVVVSMPGAGAGAPRFRALAVGQKSSGGKLVRTELWALPIGADGKEGTAQAWLSSSSAGVGQTVLGGVTAVCGLDADFDGGSGTTAVALLVEQAGRDRVYLVRRGGDGKVSGVLVRENAGSEDACRKGTAAVRVGAYDGGWVVTVFEANAVVPTVGKAASYLVKGGSATGAGNLGNVNLITTDSATTAAGDAALAWRGLGDAVVGGHALTTVVGAADAQSHKTLVVYSFVP